MQVGAAWDIPSRNGIVPLDWEVSLRANYASGRPIRFDLTRVGASEEKHEARQRALKKKQISDVKPDDDHEEPMHQLETSLQRQALSETLGLFLSAEEQDGQLPPKLELPPRHDRPLPRGCHEARRTRRGLHITPALCSSEVFRRHSPPPLAFGSLAPLFLLPLCQCSRAVSDWTDGTASDEATLRSPPSYSSPSSTSRGPKCALSASCAAVAG
jgi:hypothetical protein